MAENFSDEIAVTEFQLQNEVVYQQDKAVIDTQIATAKAYPRNIRRATENAIAIATMDKETSATCTYSVPRGGKAITGPSVHLAKIILQSWGNMRAEAKVIAIEEKHIVSQAIAFDLESNIAIKVEVKRSIMTRTGRMNDDMITVTGNAANSIALRNALFSVIPKAVTDKVYTEAKKMITGDISDKTKFLKKRTETFNFLKESFGLTEAEILSVVGKASIDFVTGDDLVVIIGVGTSIKDGDITVDEAFRKKKEVAKADIDKEKERLEKLIANCKTVADLQKLKEQVSADRVDLLDLISGRIDEFVIAGKA